MEFDINVWGVLGGAVAAYAVGALWYSVLFKKPWMREMGYTPENVGSMKMTATVAMSLGFLTTLLMSYVMAHFVAVWAQLMGGITVSSGMHLAFFLWLGFVMPLTLGAVLWENRSWTLFLINASHYLVGMLLMGGILAYFA